MNLVVALGWRAESVLAGIDTGASAHNLSLLPRLNGAVTSTGSLGGIIVLGLGASRDPDTAVLLQLGYPSAQLLLVNETLNKRLKVLRSLQLGKDLVSSNQLALVLWPLAVVGEYLIVSSEQCSD